MINITNLALIPGAVEGHANSSQRNSLSLPKSKNFSRISYPLLKFMIVIINLIPQSYDGLSSSHFLARTRSSTHCTAIRRNFHPASYHHLYDCQIVDSSCGKKKEDCTVLIISQPPYFLTTPVLSYPFISKSLFWSINISIKT